MARLYAISSGPSSVAQEGLYRRENNGSWTPLGPDQGPLYESDLNTMRFSLNNGHLILLGGSDFGVAGFEGNYLAQHRRRPILDEGLRKRNGHN